MYSGATLRKRNPARACVVVRRSPFLQGARFSTLTVLAVGMATVGACGGTSRSNILANEAGEAGDASGGLGASGEGGTAGASVSGGVPGVDEGGEGGRAAGASQGGDAGSPSGGASAGASAGGFAGTGAGASGTGDAGGFAGASGAGASGAGGSMSGEGQVGVLGGQCDPPGSLACAGNHQKVTLICSQFGLWQQNETCDVNEFCNSTPGENAGLCVAPAEECAGRPPLAQFCDGANVRRCDPDALGSTLEAECSYQCVEGTCDDGCRDNILMDCSDLCGGPQNCEETCTRGLADARPATLIAPPGEIEPGVPYQLRMGRVVRSTDSNDFCEYRCPSIVGHALQAFAFLLPENEEFPLWKITTEGPWEATFATWPKQRDVCHAETPPALLASPADDVECSVSVGHYTQDSVLWVFATAPYDGLASITLEMGNAETLADGCGG